MEAVWKIEVEDFPAFIVVDDKGNDFFADLTRTAAGRTGRRRPCRSRADRLAAAAVRCRSHARHGGVGRVDLVEHALDPRPVVGQASRPRRRARRRGRARPWPAAGPRPRPSATVAGVDLDRFTPAARTPMAGADVGEAPHHRLGPRAIRSHRSASTSIGHRLVGRVATTRWPAPPGRRARSRPPSDERGTGPSRSLRRSLGRRRIGRIGVDQLALGRQHLVALGTFDDHPVDDDTVEQLPLGMSAPGGIGLPFSLGIQYSPSRSLKKYSPSGSGTKVVAPGSPSVLILLAVVGVGVAVAVVVVSGAGIEAVGIAARHPEVAVRARVVGVGPTLVVVVVAGAVARTGIAPLHRAAARVPPLARVTPLARVQRAVGQAHVARSVVVAGAGLPGEAARAGDERGRSPRRRRPRRGR